MCPQSLANESMLKIMTADFIHIAVQCLGYGATRPQLGGRSPQSSFDSNGDVAQVSSLFK